MPWWGQPPNPRFTGVMATSFGHKLWYKHGKLHRLDGPAIEWASGTNDWAINGCGLTEEEWKVERLKYITKEGRILFGR